MTPPSGIFGAPGGEREVDVAVRDARQRGLADDRLRAAAQRRVVVVDRHRDLGLAVGVRSICSTLPTGCAADLHEVALDQLRGVLEAAFTV
jgi:hypothetical protein